LIIKFLFDIIKLEREVRRCKNTH